MKKNILFKKGSSLYTIIVIMSVLFLIIIIFATNYSLKNDKQTSQSKPILQPIKPILGPEISRPVIPSPLTKPTITSESKSIPETMESNLPDEGYWNGGIIWQTPSGCYNTESNFGTADWSAKYSPGPKLYDFTMAGYGLRVSGPNNGENLTNGVTYSWNYPVGEKTYKIDAKLNGLKLSGNVYLNYPSTCSNNSGGSINYSELRGVLNGEIISF